MSQGISFKYLDNPEKYCESICSLIQNGCKDWQNVWKAAIKDLFVNSDLSVTATSNINDINNLLKVIEKAFKEKNYNLRVQAFECWQFFIIIIGSCEVSDKLLSVLLIPLCASNHSAPAVLRAKLETWSTLVDSKLIMKSSIYKKAVPHILRTLYGPHNLTPASDIEDLTEACGLIYNKLMEKCLQFEVCDVIVGYLEKAIPMLSKNESTMKIAKEIWVNALENISQNNWPSTPFKNLMKTFQNLISCNSVNTNILISDLLEILIESYNTFPSGYFVMNVTLLIRCLFHIYRSDVLSNIMECLLKKSQNGITFFNEIVKIWNEFAEEYKLELLKNWMTVKTCFLKWVKAHELPPDSGWVLFLPIKYLHDQWSANLCEQLRSCYNELCFSKNAPAFVKNLLMNLSLLINESENVPVSQLNATVNLCKIILQHYSKYGKNTDAVGSVGSVLKSVFEKMPSHDALTDGIYKSFAPGYVATVLFFMKNYPESEAQFTPIIRKYSSIIKQNEKESSELPVIQIMSKYRDENGDDSEFILKLCNDINVSSVEKTNQGKTRIFPSQFLAKLKSSESKLQSEKLSNNDSKSLAANISGISKSQNTGQEDEDVQFIMIKPKPKSSPLTEHQKEMAKSRKYIPALYEDLSQSQSESQSQPDSTGFTSSDKNSTTSVPSIDCIEENANLPPDSEKSANEAVRIPKTFHDASPIAAVSEKSNQTFASKKALFVVSEKFKDNVTRQGTVGNARGIEDIPIDENDFDSEENAAPLSTKLKHIQNKSETSGKISRHSGNEDDAPLSTRLKNLQSKSETLRRKSGPLSMRSKTPQTINETSGEDGGQLMTRSKTPQNKNTKTSGDDCDENIQNKDDIIKQNDRLSSVMAKNSQNESEVSNIPSTCSKHLSQKLFGVQKQNETSTTEVTPDIQRKRGRPRKTPLSEPKASKPTNNELINLTDTESQNVFVTTTAKVDKSVAMTSPMTSLMELKQGEDGKRTRRKSLKARKTDLPVRSPIATRKRKSVASENVEVPKSTTDNVEKSVKKCLYKESEPSSKTPGESAPASSESSDSEMTKRTAEANKSPEKYENTQPIVRVSPIKLNSDGGNDRTSPRKMKRNDDTTSPIKRLKFDEDPSISKPEENSKNVHEDKMNVEARTTANHGDDSMELCSVDTNCSVMIIEDHANVEVISLDSDIQQSEPEEVVEKPALKKPESERNVIEDESTFFESSENMIVDDSAANDIGPRIENECMLEDVIEKCRETDKNENSKKKQTEESQKVGSNEEDPQTNGESIEEIENFLREGKKSEEWVNTSPKKVPPSPVKATPVTRNSIANKEAEVNKKDTTPSPERANADVGNDKNSTELQGGAELKRRLSNENNTKIEVQPGDAELPKTNTSPIASNTRTSRIMRLAYDSQNIPKTKNTNKTSKGLQIGNGNGSGLPNFKGATINQRTKILMANGVADKVQSPNKIITTPTERLKYLPKECTSPGILKKPDLNGSFSSPKSAKFVNFAEQLTDTCIFERDDEVYDNKADDRPGELIGDDEATSQDILYTPLQNCKDDIEPIVKQLSMNDAGLNLFHRMGIRTVGDLASINTLAAKSIPAGDNRLQRLRKALKEYDDYRSSLYESKGLRAPSARRRLLGKNQANLSDISIIELLDEIEATQTGSANGSPQNEDKSANCNLLIPAVVIKKLNDESCANILNKQRSPTKASSPVKKFIVGSPVKESVVTSTINESIVAPPVKESVVAPPVKESVVAEPVTESVISSPVKEPVVTSPVRESADISAVKESVVASPVKESIITSLVKESVISSPVEKSVIEPNKLATPNKVGEIVSIEEDVCFVSSTRAPSPTKLNPSQDSVSEDVNIAAEVRVDASDNHPVAISEAQMEVDSSVHETVVESQHDTSDEVDYVCTNDGVIPPTTTYLRLCSRLASTRASLTSLSSPLAKSATTFTASSPEIITVEKDDVSAPRELSVALDSETENSVSIFSPDATSRTKQPNMEIESQNCSQSLLDASERLTSDNEETVVDLNENADENESANEARCESNEPETENVFRKMIRAIRKPVLQNILIDAAVSDDAVVFATCSNIFQSINRDLCQKLRSGGIDRTTLQEIGLVDLAETLDRLIGSSK